MPDNSSDTPPKPRFPWLVLSLVLIVLLLIVDVSVYVVRSSQPAPFPKAPTASQTPKSPATPEAAKPADRPSPGTMAAFGAAAPPAAPSVTSAGSAVGNGPAKSLGIPKNSCQGFAEIAVRFWDLKKAGQPLQFVLTAIDQNSAGDAQKIRILKALAQVVYKNANASRDQTYGNALEACVNSPS
jgi:hypothetical protein